MGFKFIYFCVNLLTFWFYRVKEFTIHLGSNSLISGDSNRIIVATSTYTVHPQYNQNTLENDIGLIKLRIPIEFSDYIQPVPIAYEGYLDVGEEVIATGWGQTSDNAAGLNNALHYVKLVSISNSECQLTYGSQIKNGMLCAVGNYNEGICIVRLFLQLFCFKL